MPSMEHMEPTWKIPFVTIRPEARPYALRNWCSIRRGSKDDEFVLGETLDFHSPA